MDSLQALMLAEAECHSMLQTVASPFVRDRLHGMLNELLQAKQRLLTGGGEGTVGSGEGPVLAQEKQQQSGSASGTPTVTGAAALPAAFSYGLQLQDDSQQLTQQPTKRPASPNGSGEADSSVTSANGTPIERIAVSSALGPPRQAVSVSDQLQQQQQAGIASNILMHNSGIWNPPGLGGDGGLQVGNGYGSGQDLQQTGAMLDGMSSGNSQLSQYMRSAFQDSGGGLGIGATNGAYQQGVPLYPSQHSDGLQPRTASPDSWLAVRQPSPNSYRTGGAVGAFGGRGHIGGPQRALAPGNAQLTPQQRQQQAQQQQQQQQQVQQQQKLLQQRNSARTGYGAGGGVTGGLSGGPNSLGPNSYSHRMELARSNRGYVSGGGGGGAGGARMYGTGSGPASSMALQHGGGALALGLPAGGGAYGAGGSGAYGGLGGLSQAALARLQPGPYLPPALAAFANAPPIHPALQYGVDLHNGELDAMGLPLFRPLTTYSWEQSDGLVKIYVPLRGVQTDLLRATFTPTSVEVRVVALQGKNYIYTVKSLYLPINADGCHVAASKTKKNVLITLQKLCSETQEEKHWRDLSCL